jgi:hypothetical protein
MMKVFISWSGDRSKAIAEELRDWLPTIVQSIDPFISTQDVPVGGRGLNVLASELQDCSFGIICLTQENMKGQWIHFEAGALSKVIEVSRVVPLLLDLKISDLTGPLVQFQAIAMEDRDGMFALIKALAEQSSPPITESRLQRLFDMLWPELEAKVSQLKAATASEPKQDSRSDREILEEILLLSRNAERQMSIVTAPQDIGGTPSSWAILNVIYDQWNKILDGVKGKSRVAWMLLSVAKPTELSGDLLTVEFPREGDVKGFMSSNYDIILLKAILDVVGLRVRIVPKARSSASPNIHPTDATSHEDENTAPTDGYSDEPPF